MSCNGRYRNGYSYGLHLYGYPYGVERYERYERVERRDCDYRHRECGYYGSYGPYGPYVPYGNGYYGAYNGGPADDYYYDRCGRRDRCCDRRFVY